MPPSKVDWWKVGGGWRGHMTLQELFFIPLKQLSAERNWLDKCGYFKYIAGYDYRKI